MRDKLKLVLLYSMKYLGGFAVARFITRHGLRVLCYHGVSVGDEHLFRRRLFMRPETVRRRMNHLVRAGYVVFSLDEALDRLRRGALRPGSVVITIDDGWHGTLRGMFPVLHELGLKSTIYITTYCASRQIPVFEVLVGYMLWKTKVERVTLDGLLPGLRGDIDLSTPAMRVEASDRIVAHGEVLSAESRDQLSRALADRLLVDYDALCRDRRFHLLTLGEIEELVSTGVDVELHTHRHRFDLESRDRVAAEIEENRKLLEPIVGRRLQHFCYPSGLHHPRVWPWLAELGLRSATTTASGLCYRDTPPYALPRIVDGEDVSQVEFEAEMAGVLEIVRRVRRWRFVRNDSASDLA